ncbi:hypothetical protein [Oceanobacillus bengalensis]|uniref:Uncharacterized protein n=1 Tax=Oceanobacillus bengalensis TaxID=1435466 RepID=A0A494YWH4_9BACI|nr:hypothetical protein [Oceanobacillus bengalensis]RKQ14056.1 hypothetical protein D8M05_14430 [Oceanobacillus bengalensis]
MLNHEESNVKELKLSSSEWVDTLQRVGELKYLFLEVQCGEFLFWSDGNWLYRKDRGDLSNILPSPHILLTKEMLGKITEKSVENVIFNIQRLLSFYNTYITYEYYKKTSSEEYLQTKKNFDISSILNFSVYESFCHSYSFYVKNNNIEYSYIFEWSKTGEDIRYILNNSKYGYTGFYALTNFLLKESSSITDYETFTRFCKEIRKFQSYFYYTKSEGNPKGELYTSMIEVELLNPQNRYNWFNFNGNHYEKNPAVKMGDIINYFELDIKVNSQEQLNKCIDTSYLFDFFASYEYLGNITVSEVEAIVVETMEDRLQEPFQIRKDKCSYENNFSIKIKDKNILVEFLVEWNCLDGCYRIRKDLLPYEYFRSPHFLIDFILSQIPTADTIIYNNEINALLSDLLRTIEKSSNHDLELDNLLKRKNGVDTPKEMYVDNLPF